jgi:hypothetical protein
MRVLLLTGSPARYLAPPQLGESQIVAGPDWPDAQTLEGKWISLRTPVGDYDLATVLDKIPADQQPGVVVSLVDASWRNQPRNLDGFNGTKILLVIDSDRLVFPLAELLRYRTEEFHDRVVFLRSLDHLSQYLTDLADEFSAHQHDDERESVPHDEPRLVRAV